MKGTKAFELGRYDEAIREYEEAYRWKDDPVLLYNLGQAHRLAGHHAEALRLYKTFIAKVPKATNRAELVVKIASLERLIEEQRKAQNLPPDNPVAMGKPEPEPKAEPKPTEPPPATVTTTHTDEPIPAHPGRTKKIVGLVLGVVGIGLIGGGIGEGFAAKSASDSVTATAKARGTFDPGQQSAGQTADIVQGVLYGVGIAAVGAGVVVAVLGFREAKRYPSAQALHFLPTLSPTSAGFAVGGSF